MAVRTWCNSASFCPCSSSVRRSARRHCPSNRHYLHCCCRCHRRRTDRDRRPTAVVPERVHGRGLGRIVLEDGSGTQKHRGSVAQHNGGACTSQCYSNHHTEIIISV